MPSGKVCVLVLPMSVPQALTRFGLYREPRAARGQLAELRERRQEEKEVHDCNSGLNVTLMPLHMFLDVIFSREVSRENEVY